MPKYSVVFLDAQGTLLQARPSLAGVYTQACARFGRSIGEGELTRAVSAIWAEYRASADPATMTYDTSDEITRAWWAGFNGRLYDRLGIDGRRQEFLDVLWDVFGRAESWTLFPEVPEVLAELRAQGHRLAIVSNWDSRLLSICDRLGLTSMVEFVIASAVAGMEKPDRRIFEVALAKAGLPPEQTIHVGDDYVADVHGARGAGIDAIYLNRDGHPAVDEQVPTIRSLRELPELLK